MTDEINETPSTTPNFQTEYAAKLAELFPEAIADGKVDVEKIKELLNGDAADESERFGLFWPGKKRALRAAQEPTTATLKPDLENSKDWDTTKNIFIEGDNLEVLKVLQKHYHAKIKMIYIDPPYNTGKDFVYPDNYKEGLENYLEWTRQVNEEGKKVSTNAETEGRYHSNWLNMMYPRLKLARNLLTDDGVIFISIDDNEVDNLKKICNEVFGENNFIAQLIWERAYAPKNDAKYVSNSHDYVLIYARNIQFFSIGRLDRTEEANARYSNPDNDPRGDWKPSDLSVKTYTAANDYPITLPSGRVVEPPAARCWRLSEKAFSERLQDNRIWFGADGNSVPSIKRFLSELKFDGMAPTSILFYKDVGHSQEGAKEVVSLFDGEGSFDGPKPTRLLRRLLKLANTKDDSIILDFFAGSSSTAHALMQQNAEDNGKRKFIMVQLPEPTPENSEAQKSGFKTIADISRKRIKLAGEKIKADNPLTTTDLDTGFRAYKLTDTNFAKWRVSSDVESDALQQHLLELRESSSADEATSDDLLTEILLKQGYSLTEQITPRNIAGLDVRAVGDGLVLAYLDEHTKPTLEQLRAIVDEEPQKIIILEDAFQGDDELKTNLAQLAKSKGVELWTA